MKVLNKSFTTLNWSGVSTNFESKWVKCGCGDLHPFKSDTTGINLIKGQFYENGSGDLQFLKDDQV